MLTRRVKLSRQVPHTGGVAFNPPSVRVRPRGGLHEAPEWAARGSKRIAAVLTHVGGARHARHRAVDREIHRSPREHDPIIGPVTKTQQGRLSFEYETVEDDGSVTSYGGLPLVAEAMRAWGVEASIRRHVAIRQRGSRHARTRCR